MIGYSRDVGSIRMGICSGSAPGTIGPERPVSHLFHLGPAEVSGRSLTRPRHNPLTRRRRRRSPALP